MRRCLLIVGGAALTASSMVARQQQEQPPRFRAGVEVVLVDASVIDRSGRPIGDLRADDFTVTVDGKRRAVVSARFLSKVPARAVAAAEPPAPPVDAVPAPPSPPQPGRHVVIVADESSLTAVGGRDAMLSAMAFVDRLASADRVAFVTLPWLPDTLALTTDRTQLRKAMDRNVGGWAPAARTFGLTLYEALQIAGDANNQFAGQVVRRECAKHPEIERKVCPTLVWEEASEIVRSRETTADRCLAELLRLVKSLRQIEGPKTVVLFSGGMLARESSSAWRELEVAFAAAQIRLYTVSLANREEPDISQPTANPIHGVITSPSLDAGVLEQGLERLTALAGGETLRAIGSIEGVLERVADHMSASYLLGIEMQEADRDGKLHEIRVKVNRPGAEVHARRHYVVDWPTQTKANESAAMKIVTSPAPGSGAAGLPPGTPPAAVEEVLARAGESVNESLAKFAALAAEERCEMMSQTFRSTREGWRVDARRQVGGDYLLVRAGDGPALLAFRDIIEVDGRRLASAGRLKALFANSPPGAQDEAQRLTRESAQHDVGFARRNVALPTVALQLLHPSNQGRLSFSMVDEQTVSGVRTWVLSFVERRRPTFVRWNNADVPAEGNVWIDPENGAVVRTTLRVKPQGVDTETTVDYRTDSDLGIRVPSEVHERYEKSDAKVEFLTRYVGFTRLD